ncbi:MAG: hypothetical protein ABSH06_05605 [Thermodesulfobacteriota bacterium]
MRNGYNYPLFCTIAQTGQVFDVYHRPGNVHDSNGAKGFVLECLERIREVLPYVTIEVRMDGAFLATRWWGYSMGWESSSLFRFPLSDLWS